jgi:hypothetical protein
MHDVFGVLEALGDVWSLSQHRVIQEVITAHGTLIHIGNAFHLGRQQDLAAEHSTSWLDQHGHRGQLIAKEQTHLRS